MSDDAQDGSGTDNRIHILKDGEEKPWIFRDWKRRREVGFNFKDNSLVANYDAQRKNLGKNLLGVQVEAHNWETFHHIPLDLEGQHSYRMKPEVQGISHRLIVDIQLKNHVKQVTFRSGLVIQNHTTHDVQIVLANAKQELKSDTITISMLIYMFSLKSYSLTSLASHRCRR